MGHYCFNCFHQCCLLLLFVALVSQGQLPLISVIQDPHYPIVGLNLTLVCTVSTTASSPTITLRWKRNRITTEEAIFQHQFAKLALTFYPLTEGDLGTYTCETFIESEASFASASSVLSLDANNVNITGSILAPKSEVTIDAPPTSPVEGHPYTLMCSIRNRISNVTPLIEWVGPDGQIINGSDEIIVGPVAMTTTAVFLPITFVSPSVLNSGIYTCRADEGSPFVKIALDIQGVLTGLTIKVQTQQAVLNMPYRADCIASIPSVLGTTTTLLWIFPDGSHLGKVSTLSVTSLPLAISSLQTSDVGKYTCTMTVSSPALSAPILITKEMVISQVVRNNDLPATSNSVPHPTRNDLVDSGPSPKRNNSMDNHPIPTRNDVLNSSPTTSKASTKGNSPTTSKASTKGNSPTTSKASTKGNSPTTSNASTKGNDPSVPLSGMNIKPSMSVPSRIKNPLRTQSSRNQPMAEADKQNACNNTPPRPLGGRPGPLGQPGDTPLTPRSSNNPPQTTKMGQTGSCSTIATGPLSGTSPMGNLKDGRPPDKLLTRKGRQKKTLRRSSKFVA
ncbi:hypothetical protein EMCRGX_G034274 [Ephydatia muelleri]